MKFKLEFEIDADWCGVRVEEIEAVLTGLLDELSQYDDVLSGDEFPLLDSRGKKVGLAKIV